VAAPGVDGLRSVEVDIRRLPVALHPNGRRPAAAESRHLRFHDADGECRGDYGVNRVSARSKYLHASFTGEAVGRRDEAVPGFNALALVGWRRAWALRANIGRHGDRGRQGAQDGCPEVPNGHGTLSELALTPHDAILQSR
jgi:hypothetical protein